MVAVARLSIKVVVGVRISRQSIFIGADLDFLLDMSLLEREGSMGREKGLGQGDEVMGVLVVFFLIL